MIKNFNDYINENYILDEIKKSFDDMKSKKVGDIISNDKLYNYTDSLHDFDMDNNFIKKHILKYNQFKLVELNLDEIDLDSVSPSLVDDYIELYKSNNWYPPIIYDLKKDMIIDGYHRANALDKMGYKKILAWVGIN